MLAEGRKPDNSPTQDGVTPGELDSKDPARDAFRHDGRAFSAGLLSGLVMACDVVAVLVCGVAGHVVYPENETHTLAQQLAAVGLFGAFTILALKATGMYHFAAIVAPSRQIVRITALVISVFVALVAAATAFDVAPFLTPFEASVWVVCTIAALVLFRAFVARFIRSLARSGKLGRRILIYGATDQAKKLIERIERLAEPWNYIIGIFDDRVSRVGSTFGRYPIMGNFDALIKWAREHALDELL